MPSLRNLAGSFSGKAVLRGFPFHKFLRLSQPLSVASYTHSSIIVVQTNKSSNRSSIYLFKASSNTHMCAVSSLVMCVKPFVHVSDGSWGPTDRLIHKSSGGRDREGEVWGEREKCGVDRRGV